MLLYLVFVTLRCQKFDVNTKNDGGNGDDDDDDA